MKQYPPFTQKLNTYDPELFPLVEAQHNTIMGPGSLEIKTKYLILLALDAFAGSSGVKNIADVLRKMGVSDKEISEALRIAYHIAGNKVLNSSMQAFEQE